MSERPRGSIAAERPVRHNVRRVALGATVLALVVYLVACVVADLVVLAHFQQTTDARLAARLTEVVETSSPAGPRRVLGSYNGAFQGDLDDAPIVVWWLPRRGHVVALVANAPALSRAAQQVVAPADMTVAGRDFRLASVALGAGRLVAGTSAQQSRSALSTLLVIEAALAPVVLLTLYAAAWVIGRRAALPVEQARRRQLEFTADASHELRTPLSVIESEVGLALSTGRPPEEYRVALERVASESKRLRDIVDDLLWLARLDALPAEPQSEEVDLASVVEVCAARFTPVALRRGVSIAVGTDASASPTIVVAPADWLDRLVTVLIDNACRYTDAGDRVEVAASARDGRVVLTVDDSGPGIAEGEREHIFRRFHRASSVPGGAGLGLAIADAIVGATHGDWSVGRAALGGASVEVSWLAPPTWRTPELSG